jgi:hypothetical protein
MLKYVLSLKFLNLYFFKSVYDDSKNVNILELLYLGQLTSIT